MEPLKHKPSRTDAPNFLDDMSKVIPAGPGMNNVQLLVVDRQNRNRLCEPGESGEIYVRAGGLAEEYLGLPDLTATKFVENWFADLKKWSKRHKSSRESGWTGAMATILAWSTRQTLQIR